MKAPLAFEPNAGRTDRRVDFMAHSVLGGTLYLGSGQAALSLPQSGGTTRSVTVGFEGADPHAEAAGRSKLAGTANSFIGDDKSRWRSGLPTYERVRYRHVYPGIDVDFYGNQRDLEYDFRLAPGADPSQIAISHRGADSVRLTRGGDLAIAVGDTTVRQRAPVAYQRIDGERRIVDSAYELTGRTVGFRLGAYDSSRPLVIDPVVLAYSTFVGGSGTEQRLRHRRRLRRSRLRDRLTQLHRLPHPGPLPGGLERRRSRRLRHQAQPRHRRRDDAGVLDLSRGHRRRPRRGDRRRLRGRRVRDRRATGSTNFPTQDQFQTDQAGRDAFVTKLNPDSGGAVTLAYSTYLGGSGFDSGEGIAVDSAGAAYVTGATQSTNFPTQDQFQTDQAQDDVFVTKLNPDSGAATT